MKIVQLLWVMTYYAIRRQKKSLKKNHIISFLKVLFIIPCFPEPCFNKLYSISSQYWFHINDKWLFSGARGLIFLCPWPTFAIFDRPTAISIPRIKLYLTSTLCKTFWGIHFLSECYNKCIGDNSARPTHIPYPPINFLIYGYARQSIINKRRSTQIWRKNLHVHTKFAQVWDTSQTSLVHLVIGKMWQRCRWRFTTICSGYIWPSMVMYGALGHIKYDQA